MVLRIVIAVVAVIAIFLAVAATRPAAFTVVRTINVAAPPAQVYAQVADFAAWPAWSPWAKLDPEMKTSFSGTAGAVGASYAWVGNSKVGEGRMTMTQVQPPSSLSIKLEFLKPFAATNEAVFSFVPAGTGTTVSWSMTGKNNLMAKAFSIFVDMDKLVGGDFERGLGQLKAKVESAPK